MCQSRNRIIKSLIKKGITSETGDFVINVNEPEQQNSFHWDTDL